MPVDDLSWEVSTRAKLRAGVCLYDRESGEVTVRLARRAAEQFDWLTFATVVRHEQIHAWEYRELGESGHGARFQA